MTRRLSAQSTNKLMVEGHGWYIVVKGEGKNRAEIKDEGQ
jgi:hypothetical protein